MPDFDINVVVRDGRATGQIRQIRNELDKTEKKARSTRGALRGVFAGFSTAIAVREFINLSNASVGIENRLKLVGDTVGDTEVAFQRLRDISRQTRSPLEENTALFQRAAQAQRELGATNEELYDFVQATGTALAIQGGTANTARGALIQLSQAIGATVVRAEEFNSILEGALPLAQAAARGIDEAGGSVARLRQLVISGEISSREFFQAIVSEQEYLAELFARTTPTIGQAFVVLKNEAIATFRAFDQGTGITVVLANAMLFLADNLDTVARIAAGGAVFFALFKGTQLLIGGIYAVGAAITAVSLLFLTNPITASFIVIGTAIAAVIALVVAFGDKMEISGTQGGTALDLMVVLFQKLGSAIVAVGNFILDLLPIAEGTFDNMGDFVLEFVRLFATLFDGTIAIVKGVMAAVEKVWEGGMRGIYEITLRFLGFIAQGFELVVNRLIDGLNLFRDEPIEYFTAVSDTFYDIADATGVGAGQAFNEAFAQGISEGPAAAALEGLLGEVTARALRRLPVQGPNLPTDGAGGPPLPPLGGSGGGKTSTFADEVEELNARIEALQFLGQEQRIYNEQLRIAEAIGRDLTAAEKAEVEQLTKKIEILEKASDIYDDLRGRMEDYILTQQAVNSLLERGAISDLEARIAIGQSDLAQDLASVDESLGGQFAYEAQLEAIRLYTDERTLILQQAREADLISEQEYQERLRDLTQASQREILDMELARWDSAISSAQGSIDILLGAAEEYAGKQSGIYKGLFLAQKALAIAQATINTFQAVSNALALPFPPPIPQTLAAAAAAAGGAQVAAIVASTITGLAEGGRVRGPGGPRDDAAGLFALSNGEFVVNAQATAANLPLLEAMNRGMKIGAMRDGGPVATSTALVNSGSRDVEGARRVQPAALPNVNNDVQVPVSVINVSSREEALAAVGSRDGKNVILNQLSDSRTELRSILGIN